MGKDSEFNQTPDDDVHIERESAAYLPVEVIEKVWAHVTGNADHYRAPGHHPISSSELLKNTTIKNRRSELHIDQKPGRHIFYLDTLDLAFRRANTQIRLEIKQKQEKGKLCKKFAEVTIKIGQKAAQRVEEAVKIDLDDWRQEGFYAALKKGMQRDVNEANGKKADDKSEKYAQLKENLKQAFGTTSAGKIRDASLYPLVHLNRDTKEAEYSPNGCINTILELKTDVCDWETPIRTTGRFVQMEIETIAGNDELRSHEMGRLIERVSNDIKVTTDSKEDKAMRTLELILMPQNDSPDELDRVSENRRIFAERLDCLKFRQFNPQEAGVRWQPSVLVVA